MSATAGTVTFSVETSRILSGLMLGISAYITAEGSVSELTVLRGHPLLNAAAVAAVSRWRYRPTMLNGAFVSVILTVTVDFRLR